ncbi:hypothetical protein MAMMFC1_01582 [Methylomusa anaerophila]|uniref:Uncharacterized protein n=1 Tax=Methylomusa anaerophila TaxID=1930071 RepID=A0A348AIL7_9FIRM|nr:hypothetical protein MAMMFC1_01582 [Methylomusa anaerophila]
MKKIGLALCGGAVRALAHIGVLKVFNREKIGIHSICGTRNCHGDSSDDMKYNVGLCHKNCPYDKTLLY